MKNLFRSFKKTTDDELKTLWKDAIFVFDTNVLHSVYRYKASTCEDVLKLMEQLQKRVWIPHHVALEFHRNRLSVISTQHKKFDDTRKAIKKALDDLKKDLANLQLDKRHSHIDPNPLIDGINELMVKYLDELKEQENQCIKVESEDLLLSRIESIFDKRVGEKPTPEAIKNIMDNGRERYKAFIPPGYKDAFKEKEIDNKYTHHGVSYERQFGDLIVWKQIIEHVIAQDIKNIIFVTDDNKEDWWEITQGKTTSFRTELIDEILSDTKLKSFKAYSLAGFLTESKQYLKNTVSEDTIEDVYLTSNPEKELDTQDLQKDLDFNDIILKFRQGTNQENYIKIKRKILDHKFSSIVNNNFSSQIKSEDFRYDTLRDFQKQALQDEFNHIIHEIKIAHSDVMQIEEEIKNKNEPTLIEQYYYLIERTVKLNERAKYIENKLNSLD